MACADFGRRGVAQAATGDLGNLTQHLYCRESRVYDPRPKAVKEADLKRSLFDGDRHINAGTSLVRALDYGWACELNGAVTRGVDAAESEHRRRWPHLKRKI